ncbi:Metallo-hydrolase/oxidoreductase [Dendrothele bispora CBS 962.96]|uniref:Metallo-hydrolase/oxidoreductase n=1 Tax=Dendrothele bispora (strain CBS 962.96) TaxID=1314807 RepID=A0A4S8MT00_DENBC|nr:Metallo-hydrolase/oxidoreductase [Dendrothele bispora CBS 962.96]
MSKTHHAGTTYKNPWAPGFSFRTSAGAILKGPLTRSKPFEISVEPVKTVECNFELYDSEEAKRAICTTWLGHAGFLVQIQGQVRIVFDPIFSERASPSTWVGPQRWLSTPCKASELPEIHYVVISHNHYDHLDLQALRDIFKRSPNARFLVPLGVKELIVNELGVAEDRVVDSDWWDTVSFSGEYNSRTEFVCTPAQHNSGRGLLDQNHTLWASWVVRYFASNSSSPTCSIYHAGDTGYTTSSGPCPAFAEIGSKYGPFDFAMIPIWRGASLSVLGRMGFRLTAEATETLLSTLHASPRDAVALAKDVRACHTLGMHFGTFCGSEDESQEPLVELIEALVGGEEGEDSKEGQGKAEALRARRQGFDLRESWKEEGGFGVVDVGQTVIVPCVTHSA